MANGGSGGLLGLVRSRMGGPEEPPPEMDDAMSDDPLQVASDEVFDAVEAGDRSMFRAALERFVAMSSMGGGEMDEDEEI